MKLMYGSVPVKSMNIHHFEMDTNSATVQASDMQAGVTCFARGQKVVGTGKCFEFANYGVSRTNVSEYIPTSINVVEITSLDYPIKSSIAFSNMIDIDFTTEQVVGVVVVDDVEYPITAKIEGYFLTFGCEKTITLQSFYGKDRYT